MPAVLRARAGAARAPRPEKEGLELLGGAGGKLETAGSVVSIVARFGSDLSSGPTEDGAAAPAAPAAFFDGAAAARAAVRGLVDSPAKRGDFLRSASAYFGHEVPVEGAAQRGPPAPPAEAPLPAAANAAQPAARPLSSQHAANEARLAAFKAFEQPQPYRKGLSAAEAPPYTTFPNITHGYRSGGSYLRCVASLVSLGVVLFFRARLVPARRRPPFQRQTPCLNEPTKTNHNLNNKQKTTTNDNNNQPTKQCQFELHTETLNAWTTLAGNCVSVALLVATLRRERVTSPLDAVPFLLMTASGLLHAPFSTGFHLFRCMTPRVYNLWRRLDHVFIYVMCWPAVAALSWFVLPPALTAAAFSLAALLARRAALGIWGLQAHVQRDRREIVRAAGDVGALVLLQFAPMLLQSAREVARGTAATLAPSAAGAGAFVVLGTLGVPASLLFAANVFASGIPERWAPGRFNYCGSSHQLMHVGVVGAVVSMYAFMTALLRHRVAAAGAAAAMGAAGGGGHEDPLLLLPPVLSAEGCGLGGVAQALAGAAARSLGFAPAASASFAPGGGGGGGAGISGW